MKKSKPEPKPKKPEPKKPEPTRPMPKPRIDVYVIRTKSGKYVNRSDGWEHVESVRLAERFMDKEHAKHLAKNDEGSKVVKLKLKPHRMCPICQGYGKTPMALDGTGPKCPYCHGAGKIP